MKKMKKLMALALALVLCMGLMSVAAFADETSKHTITINNTDQNVSHSYEAYQIFVGKLDSTGKTLSAIQWGSGVDGDALLEELKTCTDPAGFAACETAADVADVLATFTSTSGVDVAAGDIDKVAAIIAKHLGTAAGEFTEDEDGVYTLEVTGDGYYFIKDTTTTLQDSDTKGSDTLSKYLLSVVNDVTITAKDTGTVPDKKILGGETKVAADSAAIGDKVEFEVTVDVPNTKKYEDHFVFHMNDTLPEGLTFYGLHEIKIDGNALPAANYEVTAMTGSDAFTVPASEDAAVTTVGGQTVKIVFKEFKNYVESNNLIGKEISIKYYAVVNEKAKFGATGNENEVKFDYANDPNHDYDGDEFGPDDPKGTTPESKTKHFVTTLKLIKKDDKDKLLAGATFKLEGTALNHVLVTGEKFEEEGYTAQEGETIETGTYWKLKDGSFTTTDPATPNIDQSKYDSIEQKYVCVSYADDVVNTKNVTLTATTDKNGVLIFKGLNEGNYTLTETIAPDGFNLLPAPLAINIAWDDPTTDEASEEIIASGGFSVGEGSAANLTMDADGASYVIEVVNQSGTELPSTGGVGTTLFYVVGSIMVIGAAVLLVSKRRMAN